MQKEIKRTGSREKQNVTKGKKEKQKSYF